MVTRVLSPSEALQNDLKAKLAELEREIERYRKENAALERVRREREKVTEPHVDGHAYIPPPFHPSIHPSLSQALRELEKEREQFELYKREEVERMKAYYEEEAKKLK